MQCCASLSDPLMLSAENAKHGPEEKQTGSCIHWAVRWVGVESGWERKRETEKSKTTHSRRIQ